MQPSARNNMMSLLRQLIPKSARTDERGVHLFEGLNPNEEWNLEVYHKDFIKEFRVVRLTPGQQNLLQVQMGKGVGLDVTVVQPDGKP